MVHFYYFLKSVFKKYSQSTQDWEKGGEERLVITFNFKTSHIVFICIFCKAAQHFYAYIIKAHTSAKGIGEHARKGWIRERAKCTLLGSPLHSLHSIPYARRDACSLQGLCAELYSKKGPANRASQPPARSLAQRRSRSLARSDQHQRQNKYCVSECEFAASTRADTRRASISAKRPTMFADITWPRGQHRESNQHVAELAEFVSIRIGGYVRVMEVGSAGENTSLPDLINTNYSTGVWNDGSAQLNASGNRTSSDDSYLSTHEWQIVTMVSTAVVLGLVILATIIGKLCILFFANGIILSQSTIL